MLASSITDWLSFALGAAAVAIAFWQLPKIGNQLRLAAETNLSSAYAVVSERMAALRDLLAEDDAALYPYFYLGRDPEDEETNAPSEDVLQLACEAIADFADVCVEQRKSITRGEMDWSTWDAYFRYLYRSSPVLQAFLRENQDFYPDYLMSVFGYIVVREERTGVVQSEWQVDESEDGVSGYPWMRTWLIKKISEDDQTEMLTAEVRAPDKGTSTTIDVNCSWTVEQEESVERVLYSWVLWQLTSSTVWETARILEGETVRTARLVPDPWWRRPFGPRLPPREDGFLAPVFETTQASRTQQ